MKSKQRMLTCVHIPLLHGENLSPSCPPLALWDDNFVNNRSNLMHTISFSTLNDRYQVVPASRCSQTLSPQSHSYVAQLRMWSRCGRGTETAQTTNLCCCKIARWGAQACSLCRDFRVAEVTLDSAILLFAMHRQNVLNVVSIPPLFQAASFGCILQSFFRGFLAILSLLRIYFSSPIKVYLQFENVAIHNTTFLIVVLCICQVKAVWYCIDFCFVQKDSGNIRSCVCSSILVERVMRQTFRQNIISCFTIPLGTSCIEVGVWFCIHRR